MNNIFKQILVGCLILLLFFSLIVAGVLLYNNEQKKQYEFLKEKGHNVIYSQDLIWGQCAYKKSYGVRDCQLEYNDAVWKEKFALEEKT